MSSATAQPGLTARAVRAARRMAGRCTGRLTVRAAGLDLHYAFDSAEARRWFWPLCTPGAEHEPGIARVLREELRPESVFYDVGANLGYFTVLAARLCSRGQVHAFEVDPALAERIPRSLALNEGIGSVRINCVAVAASGGELVTFRPAQEGNASTNVVCQVDEDQGPGSTAMRATTTTLDDYLQRSGAEPDLVKMDIEGAEALAVGGMRRLLGELRPTLILELHPRQIESFGRTALEVVGEVLGQGYRMWQIPEYRRAQDVEPQPAGIDELDMERASVILFRHPGR